MQVTGTNMLVFQRINSETKNPYLCWMLDPMNNNYDFTNTVTNFCIDNNITIETKDVNISNTSWPICISHQVTSDLTDEQLILFKLLIPCNISKIPKNQP